MLFIILVKFVGEGGGLLFQRFLFSDQSIYI